MEETHSFRDMAEISPETLSVLDTLGFKQATPVQEGHHPSILWAQGRCSRCLHGLREDAGVRSAHHREAEEAG